MPGDVQLPFCPMGEKFEITKKARRFGLGRVNPYGSAIYPLRRDPAHGRASEKSKNAVFCIVDWATRTDMRPALAAKTIDKGIVGPLAKRTGIKRVGRVRTFHDSSLKSGEALPSREEAPFRVD